MGLSENAKYSCYSGWVVVARKESSIPEPKQLDVIGDANGSSG